MSGTESTELADALMLLRAERDMERQRLQADLDAFAPHVQPHSDPASAIANLGAAGGPRPIQMPSAAWRARLYRHG